ncbi:45744_t:CDS:2 [Gigaspora margarita]|uniref:45744_t:CDS:1 n=1 Tax=Gigaspora margarita TaxID=4874 RepID=A0ABN7UTJ1_GIGMA|nr:45744_t:CDS:2 [Gigaspora margarita]
MLPISGSTSPQQPVQTVVYPQNSQISQFEDNEQNVKFEPVSSIPIKSEFGYNFEMDSVSSAGSSPNLVASNEFDNSHFNYNYPPPLCDDSSSETTTSPTSNDISFSLNPDQISQYYDLITRSSPIDHQNSGVQPPSFDQMRFIIYEPRQNDNSSLVPNINSHNAYGMWPVSIQNNNIDNRSISSTPQSMQPISYDFPSNPVLAHLRSHSPARPYQCPMCPRSFSRKHDLQRHIRVHTGVKPYQCPCCCKAFARTDALRRHFKMEENCRKSPEVQNMKTRRRYTDLN